MRAIAKAAVRRHGAVEILRFVTGLPARARLFLRLLADGRVSGIAKVLLLGAVVYVLSPVDFLTDLLPLAGQVDDLALLGLACRAFLRLCPEHVVAEHSARLRLRA